MNIKKLHENAILPEYATDVLTCFVRCADAVQDVR